MKLRFPFTATDDRFRKVYMGTVRSVEQQDDWGCRLSIIPVFHFWHHRDKYLDDGPSGNAIYSWGITMKFLVWSIRLIEYWGYVAPYKEPWIEDTKGNYQMSCREWQQQSTVAS